MMNIKTNLLLILIYTASAYSSNFSTTSTEDTVPPIISNLQVSSIQSTKAIVSWNTNEVTDTNVSFNVVGSNEKKVSGNLNYSLNHTVVLTKLTPQTNYVIVVTATDPSGNSTSTSINLGTNNNLNSLPVLSGSPAQSISPTENYSFTPSANDVDGDELTFSILNKPNWATFNNQTGQLSGSPTSNNIGNNSNIVISVSDGTVSVNLPAFSINVESNSNSNSSSSNTISSSYTSPSGSTVTNIVNKTPSATTTTSGGNTTVQSIVGSATQEIIMYNDGKILSSVSIPSGGTNPYVAQIESSLLGTESSLLANGSIQFKANPTNNLSILSEIKNNGGILHTTTYRNQSGQDKISSISTTHVESKLDLAQSGRSTLSVIFDAIATGGNGLAQNVETTTLVTTAIDGKIELSISQSNQNINLEKLLNITNEFSPGASVTIEGDIIKVSNVVDTSIDF